MRFTSLCAVLGAALVHVASAAPCKPSKPTSLVPATSATITAQETLSTDTPYETLSTDFHSTVTSDATSYLETTFTETAIETETATTDQTTALETTVTESATWSETTTFVSDYTSEYTATTDVTSVADVTTTTTEAAPEPTNFIKNGDFEDDANVDWGVRTSELITDKDLAASGKKFIRFKAINQSAVGGNHVNQTISDMDINKSYRLSFSGAVVGLFAVGSTECHIEAYQNSVEIGKWKLAGFTPDEYKTYSVDFTPTFESFEISMRLRCSTGAQVTVTFDLDDVSLVEIGGVVQNPPIEGGEIIESDY